MLARASCSTSAAKGPVLASSGKALPTLAATRWDVPSSIILTGASMSLARTGDLLQIIQSLEATMTL